MHDREQGDGSGHGRGLRLRGSLERLQLAALGAVENLPATVAKSVADGIGGREAALAPERDALGKQGFCFLSVRANPSWL
jgi:hypothetical protein